MICPFEPMFIRERLNVIELNDAKLFNFDSPFFDDEIGQILKQLIISTVTVSNTDRLSTQATLDILKVLENMCQSKATLSETALLELREQYQQRFEILKTFNKIYARA